MLGWARLGYIRKKTQTIVTPTVFSCMRCLKVAWAGVGGFWPQALKLHLFLLFTVASCPCKTAVALPPQRVLLSSGIMSFL